MPSQTSDEIDIDKISLGSRIVSDSDFGTVRYIGEVPPTKGKKKGKNVENSKLICLISLLSLLC